MLFVFNFGTLSDPDFIFILIAIVIGFVLHEFAHALVAVAFGDDTPRSQGRLTINPLAHISLVGLVLVLFAPIGYARAVEINSSKLAHPRLAMVLIAAAGPFANLLISIVALLGIRFLYLPSSSFIETLLSQLAIVNCNLFIFNLIPIPPLDGSRIAAAFLRGRTRMAYMNFDRFGQYVILLLVIAGSSAIILPLFDHVNGWLAALFQLQYVSN